MINPKLSSRWWSIITSDENNLWSKLPPEMKYKIKEYLRKDEPRFIRNKHIPLQIKKPGVYSIVENIYYQNKTNEKVILIDATLVEGVIVHCYNKYLIGNKNCTFIEIGNNNKLNISYTHMCNFDKGISVIDKLPFTSMVGTPLSNTPTRKGTPKPKKVSHRDKKYKYATRGPK